MIFELIPTSLSFVASCCCDIIGSFVLKRRKKIVAKNFDFENFENTSFNLESISPIGTTSLPTIKFVISINSLIVNPSGYFFNVYKVKKSRLKRFKQSYLKTIRGPGLI